MNTAATPLENQTDTRRDGSAIPPGYKQTAAGIIPEDWNTESIGALTKIRTGARNTQDREDDGSYPFFVRSQTIERINSWAFNGEAVLTAGDGVGTGKVYHYSNGKFDYHQRVYCISGFDRRLNAKYFYFYFSTHFYDRISSMTAKSSVDSVRMDMIADMVIPLPSEPEQGRIAAALSDVDALITTLDKLIAKKRAIKVATMQQVLTGNIRLPNFTGDWATKTLGELCSSITDGTHFTPHYVDDGVPFFSVENVTADSFESPKFISRSEHNELMKRCRPERGDILLTRIGALGDTKLIDWDIDASIYVSLALLKVKEGVDPRYLYCYTKSRKFVSDLEARSLLNASPKKINMGDIGLVPISIPKPPEQRAIAIQLSDMDAEIDALKRRRDKTESIKKGMMQALLTGRVRLVKPEVAA